MAAMTTPALPSHSQRAGSGWIAAAVCAAAMLSLAIAMGVGRFAFTPLLPLMVRDGLLGNGTGALLAGANYLGYLVGALVAAGIAVRPARLLALGLVGTVLATAAVGWTSSVLAWGALRFAAGAISAWTLVATSAWGLGWLATLGRPHLAGVIFAGVGLGIGAAGLFCLIESQSDVSALALWTRLAAWAGIAALLPLAASQGLASPARADGAPPVHAAAHRGVPAKTGGLIVCYALFGFGYILPATYLPVLARQFVGDPRVFGWAWPVFGAAALVSTLAVSWGLRKADRLRVWAVAQGVMAIGVLLPCLWASFGSVVVAALLVGGTFMVVTMVGMQEARARAGGNATAILGWMTAGFAFGQAMGPVASAILGRVAATFAAALNEALVLSAAGLLLSAVYLWREARRHRGAARDGALREESL
jgi:hypothetical protein